MTNAPKKTTRKAPEVAKMADIDSLRNRLAVLESFLEFLLWDVKGERGEALRKRFYEKQS